MPKRQTKFIFCFEISSTNKKSTNTLHFSSIQFFVIVVIASFIHFSFLSFVFLFSTFISIFFYLLFVLLLRPHSHNASIGAKEIFATSKYIYRYVWMVHVMQFHSNQFFSFSHGGLLYIYHFLLHYICGCQSKENVEKMWKTWKT